MSFQKVKNYIRANHWWSYKAAPLLGFTYLYIYFFHLAPSEIILIVGLSAITIIGIAGLGYAINDIYDIEADIIAGKKNAFIGKNNAFILSILLLLVAIAIAPWFWLKSNWIIRTALIFQVVLFIIYAHPFTRFKEKALWGPICDAIYGHALPIIIACMTYEQYLEHTPYSRKIFYGTIFCWQLFKGLRNIFLHQLEDYHHDIQANLNTWTTRKSQNRVYRQILFWILPLEIISLFAFFFAITTHFPWIWMFTFCFFVIYIFGHGLFRNVQFDPREYSANTYLYFLNNLYEVYLPYFFLFYCLTLHPLYFVLLMIHILLFPATMSILIHDLNLTSKEMWIQVDNFASSVKRKIFK